MFFFTLLFLAAIFLAGVTTVPLSIPLLIVLAVLIRKSWVFFAALGLGLFLDLILIRPLGYTSLVLTIIIFILFLYKRKFETQTLTFVFLASFLGSIFYLWIFGYSNALIQSLVNAILAALLFNVILSKAKDPYLPAGK